jgi:hypothetical protein
MREAKLIEAYRIGVSIAMSNGVSAVVSAIQRDVLGLRKSVDMTAGSFSKMKLAVAGAMSVAAGGAMLGGLYDLSKAAEDYTHQLNVMANAGMSQADIAVAVGDAWKNTGTVITTTARGNLEALLDLRNIIGEVNKSGIGPAISMEDARRQLPVVTRAQAVMAASSEAKVSGNANEFAFAMAKSLDIIGAAIDPERFKREADAMTKVIEAFQGKVTPQQYQGVFQFARQAKYGLSDEFKYELLPSMMLEASSGSGSKGGGSRGVGPQLAAFSRFWLQGFVNKKAIPELESLGLLKPGTGLKTTTSGTTAGALSRADIAAANPARAVWDVLMPAINKKFGGKATPEQMISEIQAIGRGNQLATSLMIELALKQGNFLRDQAIIKAAPSPEKAYENALKSDPVTARNAMAAQWENMRVSLGMLMTPTMVTFMEKFAGGLNRLAEVILAHPTATKWILGITAALGAFLVVAGTIAVAVAAVGAILAGGWIPAAIAAVAVGLAALGAAAAVYWGEIRAFAARIVAAFFNLNVTIIQALAAMGARVANWFAAHDLGAMIWQGLASVSTAIRNWIVNLAASVWGWAKGAIGIGPSASAAPAAPGGDRSIANGYAPPGGFGPASPVAFQASGFTDDHADRIGNIIADKLNGASVSMDGRKVGSLMFRDAGNSPPSGASNFDTRMSPLYPASGFR